MKVPGQRSSFHICDILDLNSTDSKNNNNTSNHNNNNNSNNNNNNNSTNTSFSSHTNTTTSNASSRDDHTTTNSLSNTLTAVQTPTLLPPPPYQLSSNLNSAIYSELGHHYHSMFPAATKSWLKEHEHYGESNLNFLFSLIFSRSIDSFEP